MQSAYIRHFGLSEPAFDLAWHPRFFYANRAYQEAFLALRFGIRLRNGVIVLTGESGVGKSTLVRMVKDRCDSSTRLYEISSSSKESSVLLPRLMRALGLLKTGPEPHVLVQELKRYLMQQVDQDRTIVVVFEDAQDLDLAALKEIESLSKLQRDSKSLLQIILVGRPELKTRLQDPRLASFKQRVALWCRLEPLPAGEVFSYIRHRLARAGQPHATIFRQEALERIAAYSKGIPGLINAICDRALFTAYSNKSDQVGVETVERVWTSLERSGTESQASAGLPAGTLHSRFGEDRPESGSDSVKIASALQSDQFPIEERMSGSEWQRGLRQSKIPPIGILRNHFRSWSDSRWFGRSAFVGILLLAGSITILLSMPDADPDSYRRRIVRSEAEPRQAAALPEQMETLEPDREDPATPEVSRLAEMPEEPVRDLQSTIPEPAAIPQVTRKEPVSKNSTSTAAAASLEKAAVVYVHTSKQSDRPVIEEIGRVLRVDGYSVRGTRFTRNETRGDVRFFFARDRRAAERVKSLVQAELGKRGYALSLQLLERDGKKFENAAPGKIEVWLPPLTSAQRNGRGDRLSRG